MKASTIALAVLSALAVSIAAPRSRAPRIDVGANRLVSAAHPGDTHYEVHAAADPSRPGRLVVGSIVYPADRDHFSTVVYASTDGGRTWKPTLDGAGLANTGDPAVAYGSDGSAYYTASSIPPSGADRSMLFFRSRDGGSTWTDSSTLTYTDRQYVTADATGGRFDGRIYVNGNNRVPRSISDFVVFSSVDGGRTFKGPGTREGFGRFTAHSMGNAVVLSDGTLLGVFGETRAGRSVLSAMTSRDGGATLTPAIVIGEFHAGGSRKGADNNVNSQPILAVDATRGPFRDRLYVVWPDRRSGRSQILFAVSVDGGKRWSDARAINDNPPGDSTDQFMPVVAVNRDGAVGVTWYDRRNHPDNMGWDVRFTASLDGGATFAPSVQVSTGGTTFGPTTPWTGLRSTVSRAPAGTTLRVSLNTFMFLGGDTAGLVADAGGVFHAVWVDNRTGIPQVWTAPITVSSMGGLASAQGDRAPARTGSAPLPSTALDQRGQDATEVTRSDSATRNVGTPGAPELSDKLALVVTRTTYERAGEVVTLEAHLENRSSERLRGPFRLRVNAIKGEFGDPAPKNADNGMRGVGAEWSFSANDLAPNEVSEKKVMTFALANLRPFREGRVYRLLVLELSAGIHSLR
ncbi:MAG: exo-alpha-sialidase [Cytophagaceae bacterium]|nr:exo-alpha-sialidase [Gemmatimonadaceae bacterium]